MVATLPTSPGPRTVRTRFVSNSSVYQSPITGATQTAARFGGVWEVTLELPPMTRRQAGEWLGTLASLNGQSAAVYAGPHAPKPVDYYDATVNFRHPNSASLDLDFVGGEYAARWITVPSPLIDGASQTGATLASDGWTEGDGLNAGDYIAFENGTFRELHIVTAECFADSNGDMTIAIAPNIRRSPSDNAAIIITSPTGEFLAADQAQAAEDFDGAQGTRTVSVSLREFIR